MKETLRYAIGSGPAEELQDALKKICILRFLMKKEDKKDDIVLAKLERRTGTQDELCATNITFLSAQLASTRQAMMTLEASLVENVRAYTRRAVENFVLSRTQEGNSEADHTLVHLIRRIVRFSVMPSRSMSKNAAKIAVISEDLIGCIAEEGSRSDPFMKPIALFVRAWVHHHVLIKLDEKWLPHSTVEKVSRQER